MLILFGTLALLQSTILPGLLIRKLCSLRGGITEQIIRLLPLSLMANYLVIFLLAALHLYTRPVMLVLIVIEVFALLWLYRRTLLRPLSENFSAFAGALRRELQPLRDFLYGHFENDGRDLKSWIWLFSGCFALSGVIWALHLCRLNFGTVFSGWDTLFSWNRYAEIWAEGSLPNIGGMYPQLIPANWSLSYLLQGEGAVQFFNTLLPPLFFLMIQIMLFDLGFQRRECSFFFAAIIARYMMKKLMGDQLFDGYMDVPVAAMSLLGIYTLMRAETKKLQDQKQAVILAVLFAAGAAITKQSGIPALVIVPLAVKILLPDAVKSFSGKQKLFLVCAALLIVLPWYGHCLLYNTRGYEREIIAEGIQAYNEGYDLAYRRQLAIRTLGKYGVCFLLSLIGLPLVPKRYRLILTLLVWPLTLIWAVSYSYDARNLGPVLPFVSLLCGFVLAGLGSLLSRLADKTGAGHIPAAVLLFIAAAALVVEIIYLYPDNKLQEDQQTKQKALFGERLNNELLYGILGETHDGYDIYTDYPAWFLPGYEECCSAAELTDTFQVQMMLEQDKINWMLLPVVMPNNTDPSKALIEQCIADGKCEQISCSDGYYKSYCLYQIHR